MVSTTRAHICVHIYVRILLLIYVFFRQLGTGEEAGGANWSNLGQTGQMSTGQMSRPTFDGKTSRPTSSLGIPKEMLNLKFPGRPLVDSWPTNQVARFDTPYTLRLLVLLLALLLDSRHRS